MLTVCINFFDLPKLNAHQERRKISLSVKHTLEIFCCSFNQNRQTLPLLLEGIHAILSKVPSLIGHNAAFQSLVWQQLCPVVISLLGIPKVEKGSMSQRGQTHDESRGFLTSSGGVGSSAKVIYG
jgi:hypothetical protein